jgi:hypothetical protein
MAIQIQLRRGTALDWSVNNPILAEGELAVETDTGKFKVGNGILNWNNLEYSSGSIGPTGPAGSQGATGAYGLNPIFSRQGTLTVSAGQQRFYAERSGTLTSVRVSVGTSPVGSPIVIDVLNNGTSVLNNTLNILPGQFTALGSIAQVSVISGDYFTVNINGVGSVTAGANLTVTLVIQ